MPELPIVSIDQFTAVLMEQIVTFPGSTEDRPVWVSIGGALFIPTGVGTDDLGALIITIAPAPGAANYHEGPTL